MTAFIISMVFIFFVSQIGAIIWLREHNMTRATREKTAENAKAEYWACREREFRMRKEQRVMEMEDALEDDTLDIEAEPSVEELKLFEVIDKATAEIKEQNEIKEEVLKLYYRAERARDLEEPNTNSWDKAQAKYIAKKRQLATINTRIRNAEERRAKAQARLEEIA